MAYKRFSGRPLGSFEPGTQWESFSQCPTGCCSNETRSSSTVTAVAALTTVTTVTTVTAVTAVSVRLIDGMIIVVALIYGTIRNEHYAA